MSIKYLLVLFVVLLTACTSLTYEKDDTKISYSRVFGELTDLKAKAGDASVSVGSTTVSDQLTIPAQLIPLLFPGVSQ